MGLKDLVEQHAGRINQEIEADAAEAKAAGLDDIAQLWVKRRLIERGLEWNRENFIEQKWLGELPVDEITGEPFVPEDELPPEFRE